MNRFFFLFHAGMVIASFPDEFINGADLGFATHNQHGPIAVSVAEDMSATFPIETKAFDTSAVNPSNVQSLNPLLDSQFYPSSGQADGEGNTALWFDETTGGGENGKGREILIPSVPTQILEEVPKLFDTTGEWSTNRKKPECKINKHLFCCQKGAPQLRDGKITTGARPPASKSVVHRDPVEYSQRRRICRSWTADDPACKWPENIFCCYCKDNNQVAYFCYNQPYTDQPELQQIRPIPEPRQISKPPQDPNPVEEEPEPGPESGGSQKRDSIVDNGDSGSLDFSQTFPPVLSREEDLMYTSNDPTFDLPQPKTVGRKRKPDTCSDKFLESVGVSPYRYRRPPKPKLP